MDRDLRPLSIKSTKDGFSNAPPNRVYNNQNFSLQENLDNVTSQLLLIDSSNKNNARDSNSKYTVDMPENFEYVTSVQLVDYKIPVCNYNITEYNNTIYFYENDHSHTSEDSENTDDTRDSEDTEETYLRRRRSSESQSTECDYNGGALLHAKIKCGKYNILDLLKHLSHAMSKASNNNYRYILLVDNITGYITIKTKHNKSFDIDFGSNRTLLYKVLGFDNKLYAHRNSYTSHKAYDLEGSKYISISITTNNGTSFKKVVSTGNASNGCFTIIPTDENYFNDNIFMKVDFNSAISFGKLMFEFRDDDGNLFNFNGRDHYLLFDVKKCFGRVKLVSLDQLGSGH